MRVGNRQVGDAGGRERLLHQAELIREPPVRPECPCAVVPDHPLLDILLARQQPLTNREDKPLAADPFDQVDTVRRVEPLEHLLVHHVEDEHIGLEQRARLDLVEQRLGQELHHDPLPQVRTLFEQRLVGGEHARQVPVGKQVGEADVLRNRGDGAEADQERDDKTNPVHR